MTAARLAVALLSALALLTGEARAGFPGGNGLIAYVASGSTAGVVVVRPDGTDKRRLTAAGSPAWSPDGTRLAVVRGTTIFLIRADGTGEHALVDGGWPDWSPDGRSIVYVTRPSDLTRGDISVIDVDGSGRRSLTGGSDDDSRPAWSPDGRRIAFSRNALIWVMAEDGSGQRPLVARAAGEVSAEWSPDGTQIAFERGGAVFVARASDGSGERQVSPAETFASGPAWSPDGRRIAFDVFGDLCVANADGTDPRRLTYDAPGLVYGAGGSLDWQPSAQPLAGASPYSCDRPTWNASVEIAADTTEVSRDGMFHALVTVRNHGPNPVTMAGVGIGVSDAGTLASTTAARGACETSPGGTYTSAANCRLPTLFPGETTTYDATVQADEPGLVRVVASVSFSSGVGRDVDASDDRDEAVVAVPGCTVVGTAQDDVLVGTPGRDVLCGLEGADTIVAGGGADTAYGGAAEDVLRGEGGEDTLDGGRGTDLVDAGAGDDLVWGGDGNDRLHGGSGDDRLYGGMSRGRVLDGQPYWNERDSLWGGPGADLLDGGVGPDVLRGGQGRDLVLARDGARDVAACGLGRDRLRADRADRALGCEVVSRR